MCMLVAHNTCTIHTETSAPVVCVLSLHMYSVFYLQNRAFYWACDRGDVVRAQEVLSLGVDVNYHYNDDYQVSYSAHITHWWVCWVSIHCTDTTSVRSLWFTLD